MSAGEFPDGIEQARRAFMQAEPELYAYIEARLVARTWKDAGDIASGALDQHGASNRCYAQLARFQRRAEAMREQHPSLRRRASSDIYAP